jgi:hypothetical protein
MVYLTATPGEDLDLQEQLGREFSCCSDSLSSANKWPDQKCQPLPPTNREMKASSIEHFIEMSPIRLYFKSGKW